MSEIILMSDNTGCREIWQPVQLLGKYKEVTY
jgi:hypothetical protein